ncbi:hypothetical protein BKK79_24285 [Cupriavidus sp. USMAA2-4]|uniref:Zinc-binding domain-containing protein n=1 Tax=Cupriavidus malaysiensis TaxID=367825 RepID=A0ABM6FEZ1_9BURK|nr:MULTISPECIES: hypothetical protein [Cupriavidus]AOY94966.1 hypothetical protein BKK79_24285 [Cupriavidus sp. USMAA2-4]AOZ02159.1 hypothetical protein BKK81_22910 [Cupriavidus sp. USMAHM13]AOZ10469.1 hypothetical protein BKK80_33405 [Cupriavidus malaysiensis]
MAAASRPRASREAPRSAARPAPRLLPEIPPDAQSEARAEARPEVLPDARMLSEIGWLQRCNHCGEYWPADGEFFPRDARRAHGIELTCKACRKERRRGPGHADEEAAEARAA